MINKSYRIEKIRILILVPHYLPGYNAGGPIRSVANMIQILGDEFKFKIITSDRDLYSDKPFSNISLNRWMKITKAEVFYASPKYLSIRNMSKLFYNTEYDILYLNSFFHLAYSIIPIFISKFSNINKKPIILAPRGEFSPGALSIRESKKRLYILFSKIIGLYKHIYWQASSELEKNDILNHFNQRSKIYIAPNIPPIRDLQNMKSFRAKKPGCLNAVFLSRISPMKNLYGALNLLKGLKGKIIFDIFGPVGEEYYWKDCLSIINELESNIVVRYRGSVDHDKVNTKLQSYDLFFLPTRGENFGHVIFEALSSGLPVIISDQTPWQDISKFNAGFVIPLENVKKYRKALNKFIQMNEEEHNIFRKGALNYASEYAQNSNTINQNRAMFLKIFSKS